MFLSKISIRSCMIILIVIVYKFLEQQKNWDVILKITLKLMVNKLLRCLRMVNILNAKNVGRKIKLSFMIYADFESIPVPESNEKQNPN